MFSNLPPKLRLALLLFFVVITTGTAGYMAIERWPFFDALYMTVITLTTVGYGETHPLSMPGRIFTIFLILSGFGLLTYGVTSGISFLLEGEMGNFLRRKRMNKQIQELSGHYIICAKGIIGEYVIEEFVKIQRPFVAVTSDQKLAEELMEHNILVLHENPAEDETLLAAGIARATG